MVKKIHRRGYRYHTQAFWMFTALVGNFFTVFFFCFQSCSAGHPEPDLGEHCERGGHDGHHHHTTVLAQATEQPHAAAQADLEEAQDARLLEPVSQPLLFYFLVKILATGSPFSRVRFLYVAAIYPPLGDNVWGGRGH